LLPSMVVTGDENCGLPVNGQIRLWTRWSFNYE
jgi:hypothetical protein